MTVLNKITLSLALTIFFITPAFAGHVTGNGGDHVRGLFLKMGDSVLLFLKQTQEGQKILQDNRVDINALQNILNIDTVSAIETPLIDNGNSSVDAIGQKGKITLQKNRWMDHFERERDVYYLVFHEMLRAIEVNDDNFVVSKTLLPFPKDRRISTRVNPVYPLIDSERLDKAFLLDQLQVNGSGCPLSQFGTRVDFDREANQLSITFEEYNMTLAKESNGHFSRKSCAVAIPIQLPANSRLVVTQMDLTANLELGPSADIDFGGEAFFAGEQSQRMNQIVAGKDVTQKGRSLLRKNEVFKSACGGTGIFRTNTYATLKRSDLAETSLASISDFKLSFKLESCQ